MSLKKLTIEGLRGFSEETILNFSLPDKVTPGSGLTVLVGPNNSGKSTIIEAIHLLTNNNDIVPLSSRNIRTNGKIKIEVENEIGMIRTIESTKNNGAFIQKKYNGEIVEFWSDNMNTFILSSKRAFSSTFNNNNYQNRDNYKGNVNNSDYRSENNFNNNFGGRLLTVYKNRDVFDECLGKVLNPIPKWTIESSNSNNLYLEFSFDKVKHSSNGAGDGYINIFNIIDSLYDSTEDNVILIDEPEISLHPDLQRKLFNLLVECSKDKQIIVSTHSPYFVDWRLFSTTAKLFRLKKHKDSIKIYELSPKTKLGINKVINDSHQPHILSLDANEIFFLNDNVILTEGQDDVLCYKRIFNDYNYKSKASFFGWGAGGASKLEYILDILIDLGYDNVFTIVDNDKRDCIEKLQKKYKKYYFYAIITDDVRNKKRDSKIDSIISTINDMQFDNRIKENIIDLINSKFKNVKGLIKSMSDYEVNIEFKDDINNLIDSMKEYFKSNESKSLEEEQHKFEINTIDDITTDTLAHNLLDDWIKNNEIYNYVKRKFKNFEFNSGGGGLLSFKNIGNNKYYIILEQTNSLSNNYLITINYYIIVDTKKKKVKLIKKHIAKNTLPISPIRKLIKKIFI